MGHILDDLDDHEGFADRRLPDGRLADGVWSLDTLEWTADVAACGCGWRGATDHEPSIAEVVADVQRHLKRHPPQREADDAR